MDLSDWRDSELARRSKLWTRLIEGAGNRGLPKSSLRNLGLYAGQAGIFADAKNHRLPDSGRAVALTVKLTGNSYADSFDDSGLLYHYPNTNRIGRTDENEIEAARDALRLELPVFVSTPSSSRASKIDAHLGYIVDMDDATGTLLVTFTDQVLPTAGDHGADDGVPFSPGGTPDNLVSRRVRERPNQQRFKMEVGRRYGLKCAVCEVRVPELLEAAHLNPKSQGGTDDARNGLQLCRNHHRALDAFLWRIDPADLSVSVASTVTSGRLGLVATSLTHLDLKPRVEALQAFYATKKAKAALKQLYL